MRVAGAAREHIQLTAGAPCQAASAECPRRCHRRREPALDPFSLRSADVCQWPSTQEAGRRISRPGLRRNGQHVTSGGVSVPWAGGRCKHQAESQARGATLSMRTKWTLDWHLQEKPISARRTWGAREKITTPVRFLKKRRRYGLSPSGTETYTFSASVNVRSRG